MKHVISTLFLACSLCVTWAQTDWTKAQKRQFREADFAFYQGDLAFAEPLFAQLAFEAGTTPELAWRLAACSLERGLADASVGDWISQAEQAGIPQAIFQRGRFAHLNYRLDEAIAAFNRFIQLGHPDVLLEEVEYHVAACQVARDQVAQPTNVRISNLGPQVNSEWQEYVPVVNAAASELYFTARRPQTTARLKDPTGQWFEDIYHSARQGTLWKSASNAGLPLNSETHDATVALSADGQTILIYRTHSNLTGGNLLMSQREDEHWSEPQLLDKRINSEYQESSACLSVDGRMVIFSSDRPGGFGGKDLYRVRRLPNGEWSLPKNLGPTVNSARDEDAPFLTADGQHLYFASNGHATMGGYDLFRSALIADELWNSPENLGYPVNTVGNDIFLTLDATGSTGYFSSARAGGFGQMDIYKVEFLNQEHTNLVVLGEVFNPQMDPLKSTLTVLDERDRAVQGVYATNGRTGRYILVLQPGTSYKVFVESDGYQTVQEDLYFEPHGTGLTEERVAPYILSPAP